MSKIGSKPITVPSSVTVDVTDTTVNVKGPQGELSFRLPAGIKVEKKDSEIIVNRLNELKKTKAVHGLFRQLISNAVIGVEKPWERTLEIVGTGYNARLQGEDLVLKLGYSHPITFKKVPGIKYQVANNTKIIVSGIDKQLVGQIAYQIKILKKPDPYKGKGIKYLGEKLRIKPGKKAKVAAGAP